MTYQPKQVKSFRLSADVIEKIRAMRRKTGWPYENLESEADVITRLVYEAWKNRQGSSAPET